MWNVTSFNHFPKTLPEDFPWLSQEISLGFFSIRWTNISDIFKFKNYPNFVVQFVFLIYKKYGQVLLSCELSFKCYQRRKNKGQKKERYKVENNLLAWFFPRLIIFFATFISVFKFSTLCNSSPYRNSTIFCRILSYFAAVSPSKNVNEPYI